MRKCILKGLFVGVTASSLVLLMMRMIPMNKWFFIMILYFFPIVGGLTSFLVFQDVCKRQSKVSNPKDIGINNYKKFLDNMNDLKNNVLLLKGVLSVKKDIEKLKKENGNLLESTLNKMEMKSYLLNYRYKDAKDIDWKKS